MPMTEFMSSAAIALIVWYGGGEIIRKELTLGELVAFLSYMRLFFQPMRELSQKYSLVQSAMASAERIFDLLDTRNYFLEEERKISALNKGYEELVNSIEYHNLKEQLLELEKEKELRVT